MSKDSYILTMGHNPSYLLEELKRHLSQEESSFRKLIVIPSLLGKEYVSQHLIEGGVLTGVKILPLPAAMDYLMRLMLFEDHKPHAFPAQQLLSLHIEKIVYQLLEEEEEKLAPLKKYIKDTLPSKKEEKVQALSVKLSADFVHYGLYGGRALPAWIERGSWQAIVWDKLFSLWDYPYKIFEQSYTSNICDLEIDIHLIGFTFLPRIYEEFLQALPETMKLYEYYFNPCGYFWGDVCSEKERFFLHRYHQKRKVSSQQIKEFDSYVLSRNTILANFGKQTQKRFNHLVDKECALIEQELEEEKKRGSLLERIQQDIFLGVEKGEDAQLDHSLQFHRAPSKKREVETLFSYLLALTEEEEIEPSDILVLAPKISEYFPFIAQVFADKAPFSICVHDLEMISQSSFLQGFWELLSLKGKLWDQKDLFALLTLRPFREKRGWSLEQIGVIKNLCETACILWGFDKAHREELLSIGTEGEEIDAVCERGTWTYGLRRLLLGLVVGAQEDDVKELDFYPLEEVERTDAERLGEFSALVRELYEDVNFFSEAKWSLHKWVEYLQALAKKYFFVDAQDIANKQAWDFFEEQLNMLMQLGGKLEDSLYPFSSIRKFLQNAFSKEGATVASANKNGICFASIRPQTIYPAKVICLLGMDEAAYPRRAEKSPLREIAEGELDPCPSSIEEDRQTLLDVLLYAKTSVLISYCFISAQDGEKMHPSFLVEELVQLVKNLYAIKQEVWQTHKHIAFHHEELANYPKYFSLRSYKLATQLYHKEKEKTLFIPEFYQKLVCVLPVAREKTVISLKNIKMFARNPLQYYFNHILGLYFREERSDAKLADREFILPALDRVRCRIDSLQKGFEKTYEPLRALGKLPMGMFEEIAKTQLHEEYHALEENKKLLGVSSCEMMTLELASSCKTPAQQKKNYWILPALQVAFSSGKLVEIEGTLELVSPQGLCVYQEESAQDRMKIWPTYLIFLQVVSLYFPHQIKRDLLFLQEGKVKQEPACDTEEALQRYLDYYFLAQTTPSPLLPMWAEAFLATSPDKLDKAIKQSFSMMYGAQKKSLDPYQKWIFAHLDPFCAQSLHQQWHERASHVFAPMTTWSEHA